MKLIIGVLGGHVLRTRVHVHRIDPSCLKTKRASEVMVYINYHFLIVSLKGKAINCIFCVIGN